MSTLNGDASFLNFDDLKPIEVQVRYANQSYVLQEASAGAAASYKNAQARSMRLDDGKIMGMDGHADADLVVLSACLFITQPDGSIKRDVGGSPHCVPVQKLKQWPNRVTVPLIRKLKDISDNLQDDTDTVETLNKQIGMLTERRNRLIKDRDTATVPKDEPASTPAT